MRRRARRRTQPPVGSRRAECGGHRCHTAPRTRRPSAGRAGTRPRRPRGAGRRSRGRRTGTAPHRRVRATRVQGSLYFYAEQGRLPEYERPEQLFETADEALEWTRGYAQDIAVEHFILRQLQLPHTARAAVAQVVSVVEGIDSEVHRDTYAAEIETHGASFEQVASLWETGQDRGGFILSVSTEAQTAFGKPIPGDGTEETRGNDSRFVLGGKQFPFKFFTGVHAVGPEAQLFESQLRDQFATTE